MTKEIDDLKAALGEVQSQLAFQEDTIEALNQALSDQQQEILTLRRQMALLKKQLEELPADHVETSAGPAEQEKPPHY